MGAQMTRELGVYNEEEKVCTPLGPQRFRLLNNDPRSLTLGIIRTPIQVQCTPTSAKTARLSENILEHSKDDIDSEEKDNDVDKEITTESLTEQEVRSNTEEVKYLETDIDKACSIPINYDSLLKIEEKSIHALHDVRSPSGEIIRSPLLVECTPELFALHSRIDSISFLDVEEHTDDPSAIVSEDDQTSQINQSSINDWLINVEQKAAGDTPLTNRQSNSPKTVARKQKELNALKKQLFFTPDLKVAAKPKARTPLGDIQAGQLSDSPQKFIRAKQWRNIQEERQRRGIPDTENTPPNLPPLLKISSAPGKITDHKRGIINWDKDDALLI